jgi:hypothetical protein
MLVRTQRGDSPQNVKLNLLLTWHDTLAKRPASNKRNQ